MVLVLEFFVVLYKKGKNYDIYERYTADRS